MYRITYDGLTIFDPYGNANEVVSDASMSVEVNASAYLDFTMAITHPLYDTIRERAGVVTLTWDSTVLFEGIIESIEMDIQGNKSISCVSAMDYLNDTHVRPYSTVAGEADLTAPSSVDGYFQWLIDQHNDHVLDAAKMFDVGINQGANLQQNNFIYRSSESEPTTASELTDQILDSLGGYLTMHYEDGRKVLDLYADLHTMNAQIVDFGVNITDFSKTTDTTDQYTAILLHGGSPTFEGGDLEGGDWSHWETHPNTPLVGDKTHGGSVASYFVSGTGEYINDSFFYSRPGRRYKATVYVKNERGSNVTIRGSYQYEQASGWTTVNVNSSLAVENKDDQWVEFSFDFQPNLSEYTKIRPRWYFDNVGNDGNRRVYLDDFSFSQIEGDTEVSEDPIGLKQVPDGVSSFDADVFKSGDVLYSTSAVERYGYKEEVFEDTTITNIDDLVQAGIKELNKSKDPQITLDIKAVDLALFMEGYTHLNVGDAVRVRSAIHDTDEFLMVNSITLDLQDPGQSEYVIGKAYDSLTGQQSGFLRSLNSGINSSLDAVASLDQTTKDQAIQIGSVEQVANQAKDTANNAQNTANNAQNTANANKEAINSIKDAQTEYEKQLEQMQQGVEQAEQEISGINDRLDQMDTEAGEVQASIDAVRQEAQTNFETAKAAADAAQTKADAVGADLESFRTETGESIQNVKQSVSDVRSDVDAVTQKAADLASDLDGTKATVEQVTTDLGEVKTTVSNAATKADQALQVSTSASQTATEARTTATSAYQDAQSALTQSSTASQTANAVKTELETKYSTTDEIAEQYATKSLVEQTSQSITSTVEATYATKATVEALENIANNAVQTWMGSGVPTLSNKPASDWTTAELKSQHSGDIYYDTDTGYSYRFGSSDGKNYSWSLIKDTDISKAVADAAKAQQTAEGVSDEVTQLKTDIPATYATKTEVKQTTDSIKSSVSEVATTANSALSKATTVEQTANGLQTTVTEQAKKLDGAVTTISQVSQRVDSVSSTITQVSNVADSASTSMLIQNPSFETGDLTGWTVSNWSSYRVEERGSYTGVGTYRFVGFTKTEAGIYSYLVSKNTFGAVPGKTYKVSASCVYSDRESRQALFMIRRVSTNEQVNASLTLGQPFKSFSGNITIPSSWGNGDECRFEVAVQCTDFQDRVIFDDFSLIDITDAKTANDTANSALSQASRVEQNLNSFKTSVSQNYETKSDALSKQSALQQSLSGFKTTVAETYLTKNDAGSTNLLPNGTFANGISGWTAVGGTASTDSTGIDGAKTLRFVQNAAGDGNHRIYTNNFNHENGKSYTVTFVARASNTIDLHVGAGTNNIEVVTLDSINRHFAVQYTATNGFALTMYLETAGTLVLSDVRVVMTSDLLTATDAKTLYTSKTDFQQTTDSIRATAQAAATNSSTALSKVSSLQVSVDGIDTRVEEVASDADEAVKTASKVSQRVDSLSSTITQVSDNVNNMQIGGTNLLKLGAYGFHSAVTGTSYDKANDLYKFTVPANATTNNSWGVGLNTHKGKSYVSGGVPWKKYGILSFYIHVDHACQINIDVNTQAWTGSAAGTGNDHDTNRSNSSFSIPANQWTQVWSRWQNASTNSSTGNPNKVDLYDCSTIGVLSTSSAINVQIKKLKFEVGTKPTEWSPCPADVDADVDSAASTANSALSKSSSVEQNLNSFKTSVSQTYETKSDASSKQSSLQQSVNNLRTEVSETYTTKTEFNNLQVGGTNLLQKTNQGVTGWTGSTNGGKVTINKVTSPTKLVDYPQIVFDDIGSAWKIATYKGGSLDLARQTVASSPGQPFTLSFDAACGTNSVGRNVWVYFMEGDGSDRLMEFGSFSIPKRETWYHYELTGTVPNTNPGPKNQEIYFRLTSFITANGDYLKVCNLKLEKGNKATEWSPSPDDMLSTDEAAQIYSTKSYVDQTSRTVSLGVVEEYKNGKHGSALATQSDITAAKDSITSTVSQTYATKNDVGVGNLIKNGDFSDGTSNWTTNGGTSKIVDGTYGKQFVFTQTGTNTNGSNRIYNSSYNHINGQAYEVSFYAKADKSSKWHFGPTGSSKAASATLDTTLKQYTMQYQADGTTVLSVWTDNPTATIHLERMKLSVASGYYATKTEVKQTSDSLTVTISSAVSKAESAATAASNAQNTANTAKNNAATAQSTANTAKNNAATAQSTADKANSNAQNAQNRVGNLETCIKMTTQGVRVGKVSNGNFTGYSALVNSNGSFDVLDSSGNAVSRFTASTIELGKNSKTSTVSMCGGVVKFSSNSGGTNLAIDTQDKGPITINDRQLGMFGRACQFGSASHFKTTAANKWVKASLTPQYINSDGVTETNVEPFASVNGGVKFNVSGLYLISISAYARDVAHLDVCHLGLMNSVGTIQMEQQVCAGGNWDGITHTECRQVSAGTTLWMVYKCENAAGSSMDHPFMTCAFLSYAK